MRCDFRGSRREVRLVIHRRPRGRRHDLDLDSTGGRSFRLDVSMLDAAAQRRWNPEGGLTITK